MPTGGVVQIAGSFSNSGGSDIKLTGGSFSVAGAFTNTGGTTIALTGGNFSVGGDFTNNGDSSISVGGGGSVDLVGNVYNSGGASIAVTDGSLSIDKSLENTGGGAIAIAANGSMDIGQNFYNSSSVVIDGIVTVTGTVTEKDNNGSMTGSGFLDAGTIIDNTNRISENLTFNRIYVIADGNWSNTSIWSLTQGGASCNCLPSLWPCL